MIEGRLAMFLLWGGGCVVLSVVILVKRWRNFRKHRHDRRKAVRRDVRRDVLSGFALLMASGGSAVATAGVLFGEAGSTPRTFALALALGGFLGALFVMATEEDANGME